MLFPLQHFQKFAKKFTNVGEERRNLRCELSMSTGSGLNNNEEHSKVSDSVSFSFAAFPFWSLYFSGIATIKTEKSLVSDKGL